VPLEKRTRVEIFLPIRSDTAAYQTVTEWLAEELAFARGGSTLTTPFTGLYYSATDKSLARDQVHILFCDFALDVTNSEDAHELAEYLDDVRRLLMEILLEEDVWIIFYPSTRIV
jgi:hypothetical protein